MPGLCPPLHARRRKARPNADGAAVATTSARVRSVLRATPGRLQLDERKLAAPAPAGGLVRRTALVNRLLGARLVRCVEIAAPAGYGKTTLLAQWAARDPRPFAWVAVDGGDDDPAVLLAHVTAALRRALGIDARRPIRTAAGLGRALAAAEQPAVLVLDDVHELAAPEAWALVASVAERLPPGSQLVLAGRRAGLPVARWRASRQLFALHAADLALTRREAGTLLHAAGLELDEAAAHELHARCEGWAAGLYLAALSLRAAGPGREHAPVAGTDPHIAAYLREEHLDGRSGSERSFLVRSSVLPWLSGPLCDAALQRADSACVLASLAAADGFLVAGERPRPGFRHHGLVREFLRGELERLEPGGAERVARDAARWCDAQGDRDGAIAYALEAGDVAYAAGLVSALEAPLGGCSTTALEPLLDRCADAALLDRHPALAVHAAWLHARQGRAEAAIRWAAAVERVRLDDPAPDGSATLRPWAEVLRGAMCQDGADQVRPHAEAALAGLAPLSAHRPTALLVLAGGLQLEGDDDVASDVLDEAVDAAARTGAACAGIEALSRRALLRMGRGDHRAAEDDLRAATALADAGAHGGHVEAALLYAAGARLATLRANARRAREELERADALRPLLTHALPWLTVGVLLELAQARLALGDARGARADLADAAEVTRRRPALGVLRARADALAAAVASAAPAAGGWAASLTAAELRLLPLLTTHLTFAEIGLRLHISRNTVKTEAISVYRKLGASNRSEAIERATGAGLIDEAGSRGLGDITRTG